jgi:hypothetical protein
MAYVSNFGRSLPAPHPVTSRFIHSAPLPPARAPGSKLPRPVDRPLQPVVVSQPLQQPIYQPPGQQFFQPIEQPRWAAFQTTGAIRTGSMGAAVDPTLPPPNPLKTVLVLLAIPLAFIITGKE